MAVLEARKDLDIAQLVTADEAATRAKAEGADAILIRTSRLSASMIDAARSLKVVARHGVGYDNIDLEALNRRRIPLALVGPVLASSVAEHTLYLLLAAFKCAIAYDRATREGKWSLRESLLAADLAGKTLLIVGYGRIGREVARRAAAFGLGIMVFDPFLKPGSTEPGMEVAPDLDAALATADAVTLNLPLTPESKRLFDAARITRMKRGAILVSTARGGIVDEQALADALRSGHLRSAGLDVFEQEPPSADNPLFALDNVVLTPHCASLTEECAERMAVVSAQNCLDGLDGRLDPSLVVNPHVLGGQP
jgi:D-3-phosphoglycerate dehydrogenase